MIRRNTKIDQGKRALVTRQRQMCGSAPPIGRQMEEVEVGEGGSWEDRQPAKLYKPLTHARTQTFYTYQVARTDRFDTKSQLTIVITKR